MEINAIKNFGLKEINSYNSFKNDNKIQKMGMDYISDKNLPSRNYFLAFCGIKKNKYNPKNDVQLQNIRKNYLEGNIKINYAQNTNSNHKDLLEKFLSGKDKILNIRKIIGSNGNVYLVKDKEGNSITIKAQHIKKDGRYPDMITRLNFPDFDIEYETLKKLPPNINSTQLIADIIVTGEDARRMLAISFIDSKRLIESPESLNKENLEELYNTFLVLDKNKIFHRDLNATNIVVEKGTNKLFILDYGAGKTFDKMKELAQEVNNMSKEIEQEKQKQSPNKEIIKNLENKLQKNLKFKKVDGIEISNLENFEALGLLPALMFLSKTSPKIKKNNQKSKADKLFLEHLKLSADYHKKRLEFLDKNSLEYKNEQLLYSVLSIINPDMEFKNDAKSMLTKDIAILELYRIKMAFANKASRLYTDTDRTNYKIASYWTQELGAVSAFAKKTAQNFLEKYKNNKLLSDYFKLNIDIANFYNQDIYPKVHKRVNNEALNTYTCGHIDNKDRAISDGHWFEANPKFFAPSCYYTKTKEERNLGLFDFC